MVQGTKALHSVWCPLRQSRLRQPGTCERKLQFHVRSLQVLPAGWIGGTRS